jgi:hypothetical protein
MKHLLVLLCTISLFAACKSQQIPDQYPQEKYTFREISRDSAELFIKNFESSGAKFKETFRKGMNIPMKVINELQDANGMGGIAIYYGRSPEFLSPVFILFQSQEVFQYKPGLNYDKSVATKTYVVYYPCPTQCAPRP